VFGYPNCPFFSCKLCFWSENLFQKKTSGVKGESEKINKMGGKGKRKKGGGGIT
jgi:hypothetical protein